MQTGSNNPILYVFFGLIASGKSTLAEHFAGNKRLPYYNTDRVRKELAGSDPSDRRTDGYNLGIYTREFSRRTYQEMLDRAAADIRSGCYGVVLDGSYNSRDERGRVMELADSLGAGSLFIQCVCSEAVVKERLKLRARDSEAVSDGSWEIYLVQKERFQPPEELEASRLITVNTEQPVARLLEKLAATMDMM